ncbi:MAG: sigma-70 family RNA polymerase sigma factor [Polyangiales bacterium]
MSPGLPIAPEPALDELSLAQRCAAGDLTAQHLFFERERHQVHRTLYRVLGSNQHMEDLLQETFIEVFGSLQHFRGESSLHTWVDTIAARVVYRHLARRRQQLAPLSAADEVRANGGDLERQTDARHALRQLYGLLDRLEPKYRVAYTLHVIDGRPLKEIAAMTHCSVMAVKNRIWRARQWVHERAARDPVLRELVAAGRATP